MTGQQPLKRRPQQPVQRGIEPVHRLGHYQGGQQRQEYQRKYPEEAVLRYGEMWDELPVDYPVAYPGHEIGGKGQLGHFV